MKDKNYRILNGTALKFIAIISMVLDHVGDSFFPEQIWMRVLGRIAMPVFAFCVAEGFTHTHDRIAYLRRLLLFGLVSEIPFDLVTSGKILEFSHQNIMFSFAWAICGLLCFEKIRETKKTKGAYALGLFVMMLFMIASAVLGLDYNMLTFGLVAIFYLYRDLAPEIRILIAMAFHVILRNKGIYWFGLLGFIPLFLYNGQRGRGFKWLFYFFYPGHLLLIWLIKSLI